MMMIKFKFVTRNINNEYYMMMTPSRWPLFFFIHSLHFISFYLFYREFWMKTLYSIHWMNEWIFFLFCFVYSIHMICIYSNIMMKKNMVQNILAWITFSFFFLLNSNENLWYMSVSVCVLWTINFFFLFRYHHLDIFHYQLSSFLHHIR